MTLDEARDRLQWFYLVGAVVAEREGEFRALQAAVAHQNLTWVQDSEGWHEEEGEGVPTTEPVPERVIHLTSDQLCALKDLIGDARDRPRNPPWSDGPVRHAISDAIESLPHGHALEARLVRADDLRSEWAVVRAWAKALAWYWGVDAQRYARAIGDRF